MGKEEIQKDSWNYCYKTNWQNRLHPDGIDHPAKISYQLIHKIYQHLSLPKNAKILDPFAGVSCTALHSLQRGYHWTGIEIEPKFVELSQKNLDFWNSKYSQLPNWGTATIIQGDSTSIKLPDAYDAIITSPPYEGMLKRVSNEASVIFDTNMRRAERSGNPVRWATPGRKRAILGYYLGYGTQDNNLGNLTGPLFWDMMKKVIDGIYIHLKQKGIVVWITKDVVRNKERIYIANKIIELSEPYFELIHHHRANLVEDYGTQITIDNKEERKQIKRASFCRLMVEKHYPECTIDWEDITCLQKHNS